MFESLSLVGEIGWNRLRQWEELSLLSDSMRQASAMLADEDEDETSLSVSSRRVSTLLNVVALVNTLLGNSKLWSKVVDRKDVLTVYCSVKMGRIDKEWS